MQLVNQRDERYKRLLYFDDPKKVVGHIARGINPQINTEEFIRPVFNYYNRFGSTKYVNGNTSKEVVGTVKSHVNYVVMDSDWEGVAAKTLDEIPEVISYVKNQFLGFAIPYVNDGVERQYFPDFIARIAAKEGETPVNLIIEVTGMSREKAEKKWYVENRWLPAVNAVRERYGYGRWHFIEIANDIRDIRGQLRDKIAEINL